MEMLLHTTIFGQILVRKRFSTSLKCGCLNCFQKGFMMWNITVTTLEFWMSTTVSTCTSITSKEDFRITCTSLFRDPISSQYSLKCYRSVF